MLITELSFKIAKVSGYFASGIRIYHETFENLTQVHKLFFTPLVHKECNIIPSKNCFPEAQLFKSITKMGEKDFYIHTGY